MNDLYWAIVMAGRAFVAPAFTPPHIKNPSECIWFSSLSTVAAVADAALQLLFSTIY